MNATARRIVRYRNRKLYEASERRFVTLRDLARTVAAGGKVEVIAADTGEDITARTLSRALASDKAPVSATTDTLTLLFQAGSSAAETMAGVVEKVGGAPGSRVAASMRRVAHPDLLAERFAPLARRLTGARQDVEQIVAGLVQRGRMTWEEGARVRDDIGAVIRESLSDILGGVKDLGGRLNGSAGPEVVREIADLKTRLSQLEALAQKSFPSRPPKGTARQLRRRTMASRKRR